ncbi:MAG: dTMP kinase [Hyphomicrobiales bacterium]|nr:dTMP kinase [Hyphomicrobiales bacterium]
MPRRNGMFITFEGSDGSGKSTQAELLARSLRRAGLEVIETREPGGSPRAEAIRELLLSGKAAPFGAFAETMLFNAARADHLRATIRPALARSAIVICDRFADSTRAYQGVLGKIGDDLLAAAEAAVVGDTAPDLTIILDLPADVTVERLRARREAGGEMSDKFEEEALAHHEALRHAFLDIAARAPARCVVLSAQTSVEELAQAILRLVEERLGTDRGRSVPRPSRSSDARPRRRR